MRDEDYSEECHQYRLSTARQPRCPGAGEKGNRAMRNLLIAAYHALRSYQHGNSSVEPAKGVADWIEMALTSERPRVVCLCGSTRFWREFQRQGLAETMAGRIVLSIGAASGTDDEHFGNLPREEYDRIKMALDNLHLRKIDIANEILVLNVDGYVGESTRREIEYAHVLGKRIRWLEPDKALALPRMEALLAKGQSREDS